MTKPIDWDLVKAGLPTPGLPPQSPGQTYCIRCDKMVPDADAHARWHADQRLKEIKR
jgi:hypothetical protein